jgi:hypothetical protein
MAYPLSCRVIEDRITLIEVNIAILNNDNVVTQIDIRCNLINYQVEGVGVE